MPKFTSTTKPVGAFVLAAALTCAGGALAEDTLKVGVVGYLTGSATGPFGIPARDAAELMIEAINSGTVPAPYDSAGIGGLSVDPINVDEAGGSATHATMSNVATANTVDDNKRNDLRHKRYHIERGTVA